MSQFIHYLVENAYWLMFISAFTSSSILPGNSELVFSALVLKITAFTPHFSSAVLFLLICAITGNTLGSITSYWLGCCFSVPQRLMQSRKAQWALPLLYKYGNIALLLSWLPVIGDVLCILAGWLRLNKIRSFLFILLGKTLRYLLLFITLFSFSS